MTEQTSTATAPALDQAAAEELKSSLKGAVLQPGDTGYDEARQLWNGMIDKKPALIAQCTGTADVMAAVTFAQAHGLPPAVRGGGHSVPGHSMVDGGLVIDLSPMRGIFVDPANRTVRAQGGVTFGDFDHECQAFGLAVTGGHISSTGIAGLTLGGGIGWLVRKYGLTSDNLISVDLVTADGEFVTAGDDENADLFWGVRGGGGNFGIATSFTYRLHPIGTMIVGGLALWPADQAQNILHFYRDYIETIPDELTTVAAFLTGPPAPFLPEHLHGATLVGIVVCYTGDLDQGLRVVQPIKDRAPAVDLIGPMPYLAQQTLLDAANPKGHRYFAKTDFLEGLTDEVIDTVSRYGTTMTSPLTAVMLQHYGGAVSRLPDDASAFSQRDRTMNLFTVTSWTDPAEDERHIAWTRDLFEAIRPFSQGSYLNFMGADDDQQVQSAYSPQAYERLVALKKKYDPTNLFRHNTNINPAP